MAKHFHPPVFRMPMYGWHADSGILSSSLMCSFDINPSLYITSDRFSFTDKSSSESADDLDVSHCSLILGYGRGSYMLLSRCSLTSPDTYVFISISETGWASVASSFLLLKSRWSLTSSVLLFLSRCSLNSSNIYLLKSPRSLYLYST